MSQASIHTPSDGIIRTAVLPRENTEDYTRQRRGRSLSHSVIEGTQRENRVKSVCRTSGEYTIRVNKASSGEIDRMCFTDDEEGEGEVDDRMWVVYSDNSMREEDMCKDDLISYFRHFNQLARKVNDNTYNLSTTRREFLQATLPLRGVGGWEIALGDVASILHLLDPYDNLYFLNFKLDGVSTEELDAFLDKLNEHDRARLEKMSKSPPSNYDLSYDGRSIEIDKDVPPCKYSSLLTGRFPISSSMFLQCLREYPTYIAKRWLSQRMLPCRDLYALYELDYSLDLHRIPCDTSILAHHLIHLTPELEDRQLSLLACMIGVRHTYFRNESYPARILPGDQKYNILAWLDKYRSRIEKYFGRLPTSVYSASITEDKSEKCIFMDSFEE